MQPFEIIAHRGFSEIAPENTLAAFSAALQQSADSIEFDIQLSSDGVPVIIHDISLDRTTNGSGKVREKTLEQLKALDAGSWFDPQFSGEKIPTLTEGLNIMSGKGEVTLSLGQFIYPEVKGSEDWTDSEVDRFVKIIRESGWENKCVVACFNESFLARIREKSSQVALGYLVDSRSNYREKLPKAAADDNAIMMSQYQVLLENPALVETSRSQGVDIVAWTVDGDDDLHELARIGVVRIVTNSPTEAYLRYSLMSKVL